MNDVELSHSMWPLSQAWYGDRLDSGCSAKPMAEPQAMLTIAGLTGDLRQLSP